MHRLGDDHIETPVLIVAPNVRVITLATLPPGAAFLVDGETWVVNGERPFSKNDSGDTTTSSSPS